MKLELKAFQEKAARDIIDELDQARASAARGREEAVILAAPTGSGKTITLAQVIDLTFGGGDGVPARPNSTFLWLSDSPELNQQSSNKLISVCDHLPFHKIVMVNSESVKEDRLQAGHVYFINTQLLGKDKLLTKEPGDRRPFTFWQTVANTIAHAPEDFILIIDEAHRGATATDRNRLPIMQKFIIGSPPDGLPPVPLVLGMSATPQRFRALLGNANRIQRPINIDPEEVRASGLLKDWILVRSPKTNATGDLTLLENAARSWAGFAALWRDYCLNEHEKETIRPILVVQVEDGSGHILTRTPLDDVVRVIERQTGPLGLNEIVHCFQDQNEIQAGGRIIRKLEASRIQDSPDVKVVLFKTALTTGWDCPRAEVMMSFRRAQDATSIAQLVGRMIRTPLARRIGTNEVLDTVELFLPHYDTKALEDVLARLRSPEAEERTATRVETAAEPYHRNASMADVFEYLQALPTYTVSRVPKMSNVKRALRLAGMLVHEGVNADADEEVRDALLAELKRLRDHYARQDAEWARIVRESAEIEIDVTKVAVGYMQVTSTASTRMVLSAENIDQLFDEAGRMLAAGQGLHRSYWKRYHDREDPGAAKLELYAVLRQPETLPSLERLAVQQFNSLWAKHKPDIQQMPASMRERFHILIQASGMPLAEDWELPDQIVEKQEGDVWAKHLYVNEEGDFWANLNAWEAELLEAEIRKDDFVAWLRNFPRRDWALCIPYEFAGMRPFYPDFIIVRKIGSGLSVDVLEPHDDSRTDTWAKAKGLAVFADEHGMKFGSLIIATKKGNFWQLADINNKSTREKARRMQSSADLESLFANP